MKCVLSKVYVGHSQDMRQFNIVEGGHFVIGNIFGSFIRFQVTEDRDPQCSLCVKPKIKRQTRRGKN